MRKAATVSALAPVSNDGREQIEFAQPYAVDASVEGNRAILFHRWSVESVEAKANAAKGSKAKKTDDIPSYVYRMDDGILAIPGEYFRMSIVNAAKFRQDPRSPRKSAMDLFKAGFIVLDDLCSLGAKDWDFVDQRRVTVQRNGVTRCRPAMFSGWKVSMTFLVNLPEYITPDILNGAFHDAGRLIGVGDFRPTFGRYQIVKFAVRDA